MEVRRVVDDQRLYSRLYRYIYYIYIYIRTSAKVLLCVCMWCNVMRCLVSWSRREEASKLSRGSPIRCRGDAATQTQTPRIGELERQRSKGGVKYYRTANCTLYYIVSFSYFFPYTILHYIYPCLHPFHGMQKASKASVKSFPPFFAFCHHQSTRRINYVYVRRHTSQVANNNSNDAEW